MMHYWFEKRVAPSFSFLNSVLGVRHYNDGVPPKINVAQTKHNDVGFDHHFAFFFNILLPPFQFTRTMRVSIVKIYP